MRPMRCRSLSRTGIIEASLIWQTVEIAKHTVFHARTKQLRLANRRCTFRKRSVRRALRVDFEDHLRRSPLQTNITQPLREISTNFAPAPARMLRDPVVGLVLQTNMDTVRIVYFGDVNLEIVSGR
jgi:hypothetical protein